MRRVRDAVGLLAWTAFLAGAMAVLHAVGRGALAPPPPDWAGLHTWAATREPAAVAAALCRLGAMGLGWYLLGVTALGTVVRLVRLAPLTAAMDALTIPGVRSMLAAAVGASLSVAAAQPASAAARIPVMHRVSAPSPPPTAIASTTTTSTTVAPARVEPPDDAVAPSVDPETPNPEPSDPDPGPPADPDATPVAPAPQSSTAAPAPGDWPVTWTVAPGDNLWRIAASVLERSSGHAPGPADVVPYWRSLIEANRSRLRDPADPGLIFAGQVLALPDAPAA